MARIFLGLSVLATLLLIANALLGFAIGDFGGVARGLVETNSRLMELEKRGGSDAEQLRDAREQKAAAAARFQPVVRRATLHKMLGIAAALITVLVNFITVSYFIGTSRWCLEVVDT